MLQRILIANRGEIALRVIRTAREMGLETVAIYSDWDQKALHTRMAHAAMPLGGSVPRDTYLRADKILDAARKSGAQAIHPGYGFLSENAAFARAVRDAGLVWIGPPPEAIEAMGDKIRARKRMRDADVPVVPGLVEPLSDPAAAKKAAAEIGYPIAIKASAGGGGKGIRIVREPSAIESAFKAASGEALSSFGDGRVYMERYLDEPRHIEVQVLFDQHENGVHLGVRECSIQRRHQKLIEECPSVVVDAKTREAMGAVALRAGRAVGYQNAGTVEFLWSKGQFYFLEMNTRLQVEHPVTEMVTGLDLVREQIRIARGEKLGYGQDAVRWNGWAIEVRINAEDPRNGFLPSVGTIRNLRMPGGPFVRLDLGMYRGMEVGVDYDPMLGKLIAWGATRDEAIDRLRRALQEINVGGVRTSLPAALTVLEDARFRAGQFDTHFLESLDLTQGPREHADLVAAAASVFRHHLARRKALGTDSSGRGAWLARSRRTLGIHPPRTSGPEGTT